MYKRQAKNKFSVNAATNALELVDLTAIEAQAAVVQEQALSLIHI